MNFFEAQARARRSTTKLVILFVIAVLAIVLSVNLVVAALVQLSDGHGRIRDPGPYVARGLDRARLFTWEACARAFERRWPGSRSRTSSAGQLSRS